MNIAFSKMHGIGNDFIVINELSRDLLNDVDKGGFVKKYCDRRLGIGADAVIFLRPPKKADLEMQYFNADGSRAENCVNGLRCVALEKYLLGGKKEKECTIEATAGLAHAKIVSLENNTAVVEIDFLGKVSVGDRGKIEIDGKNFDYFPVDVGNPHAVIFTDEPIKDFPVEEIGHKIEFHEKFVPGRVNTEFVNIASDSHAKMRVHERGACETQACGSGSIAIAAAGAEAGLLKKNNWVTVEQPGGKLEIFIGEKVLLRGNAEKVFEGTINLE